MAELGSSRALEDALEVEEQAREVSPLLANLSIRVQRLFQLRVCQYPCEALPQHVYDRQGATRGAFRMLTQSPLLLSGFLHVRLLVQESSNLQKTYVRSMSCRLRGQQVVFFHLAFQLGQLKYHPPFGPHEVCGSLSRGSRMVQRHVSDPNDGLIRSEFRGRFRGGPSSLLL